MKINAEAWGKLPAPQANVVHVASVAVAQPSAKRPKPTVAAAVAVPEILPPGVFGVEDIVDIKVRGKHLMYLVKWVGHPTASNSWEPEDNILDPALLANFQRNHSASHQAAIATIAKRKEAKALASSDTNVQQSPAELQQQADRSSRSGRVSNVPARFMQRD